MTTYKNLSGNSGVQSYELGEDRITVQFKDGSQYLYTYNSAGSSNIEEMKQLAESGRGLNSFIKRYVNNKYERKLR